MPPLELLIHSSHDRRTHFAHTVRPTAATLYIYMQRSFEQDRYQMCDSELKYFNDWRAKRDIGSVSLLQGALF